MVELDKSDQLYYDKLHEEKIRTGTSEGIWFDKSKPFLYSLITLYVVLVGLSIWSGSFNFWQSVGVLIGMWLMYGVVKYIACSFIEKKLAKEKVK